jgi:tRNA A-37 threonylcarbamoyl transferase component Bud32
MVSSIEVLFERKRKIEDRINKMREKSEAKMIKVLIKHGIETPEQLDAMLQKAVSQ